MNLIMLLAMDVACFYCVFTDKPVLHSLGFFGIILGNALVFLQTIGSV